MYELYKFSVKKRSLTSANVNLLSPRGIEQFGNLQLINNKELQGSYTSTDDDQVIHRNKLVMRCPN